MAVVRHDLSTVPCGCPITPVEQNVNANPFKHLQSPTPIHTIDRFVRKLRQRAIAALSAVASANQFRVLSVEHQRAQVWRSP